MTNSFPCIVTPHSISVLVDSADGTKKNYIIASHDTRFVSIRDAIRTKNWDQVREVLDVKTAVTKRTKGLFEVTEDSVTYKGEVLHNAVVKRIIAFLKSGEDFDPLLKFLERLLNNPSSHSIDQLYEFLENKNLPVDPDGCFYAYKAIRADYKDIYSGTIDNSIGAKPEMPRRLVDDNFRNHCSKGLHVGALDYVESYGGIPHSTNICVLCKVDPADVVSVPEDCGRQKVRVSKYEVVALYTGPMPETVYRPGDEAFDEVIDRDEWTDDSDDWDDWDDDMDEEDDHEPCDSCGEFFPEGELIYDETYGDICPDCEYSLYEEEEEPLTPLEEAALIPTEHFIDQSKRILG